MNIDQLIESLSENTPDPDQVLASVGHKRRTARNRMYAASGGLAVAVAAVVTGVLLHGAGPGSTAAESAPANGIAAPAASPAGRAPQMGTASGLNDGAGSTASCSTVRLQAELAEAVRKGASVIVGYGTLAGGSATAHGTSGATTPYYSLTLKSVQTLAGPAVTSGSVAWVAEASQASASPASASPSATPSTEVFGIVSPAAPGTPGPVLQAATVADGQVILSGSGCLNIAAGSPLASTFGPSANGQFNAGVVTRIPLATAEKIATQSG